MSAEILIKGSQPETLDVFVSKLSALIGCTGWERRESSNYVDGKYFRSFSFGVEITASIAGDREAEDFQFTIHFKPEPGCGGADVNLAGLAFCSARKLAQADYEVVRVHEIGRVGSRRSVYRRNINSGATTNERVSVEVS